MPDAPDADRDQPPGAAQVLSVIPIVLAVTALVRWLDPSARISPVLVFSFAAGGAGLVGVPALFWLLDQGRRGLVQFVALGVLAGLIPLSLVLLSGVLGRFVFGRSLDYVRSFLEIGAPIPMLVGAMPWPEFWLSLAEGAAVGLLSAVVCWIALVRRSAQPTARR